jgi:hypothetical protein
MLTLCLGAAGCGENLDTSYGQRKGTAPDSVNGTAVFAKMFQQAGHKVHSWGTLSPRLKERADCIVWFPDSYEPASGEVRRWLRQWLLDEGGRTLIYVGRDFDAAVWYWDKVGPNVPNDQKTEFLRRRTDARKYDARRRASLKSGNAGWYTLDAQAKPRKVRSLQGEPDWLAGVDPAKLEIELRSRIAPPAGAKTLLESDGDTLISCQPVGTSKLIVVANGSFLLNLALVNHEHRKLAGRLVREAGSPQQTVVFLESGPYGPGISEEDPSLAPPTGLEIFSVWPTSWILLHLAAAGIIFCLARYPIFGRPLAPQTPGTSDFGKHVEALGKLLKRSRDPSYAMTRLRHYRETVRGDGRKKE